MYKNQLITNKRKTTNRGKKYQKHKEYKKNRKSTKGMSAYEIYKRNYEEWSKSKEEGGKGWFMDRLRTEKEFYWGSDDFVPKYDDEGNLLTPGYGYTAMQMQRTPNAINKILMADRIANTERLDVIDYEDNGVDDTGIFNILQRIGKSLSRAEAWHLLDEQYPEVDPEEDPEGYALREQWQEYFYKGESGGIYY